MKLVIISDIHGSLTSFKKINKYLDKDSMLLIAGDLLYHGARNPLPNGYDTKGLIEELHNFNGNFLAIKGNVDALVDDWVLPYPLAEYAIFENNSYRIVIYHGHQHQSEAERVEFAKRFGANMVIYGHTHIPIVKEVDGIILLNPGSISLPKQEPNLSSLAILEDRDVKIISLEDGVILDEFKIF